MAVPAEREIPAGSYEPLRELLVMTVTNRKPARTRLRRIGVPAVAGILALSAAGSAAAVVAGFGSPPAKPLSTTGCRTADWRCMPALAASLRTGAIGPTSHSGATVTDISVFARNGARPDGFYYLKEPAFKATDGRTLLIFVETLGKKSQVADPRATAVTVHGMSAELVTTRSTSSVTWTEDDRVWSVSTSQGTPAQTVAIAQGLVTY